MEEWRRVPEIDIELHASNLGRIRRPAHKVSYLRLGAEMSVVRPDQILSPQRNQHGYLRVQAMTDLKACRFAVHRLVALAFVPGYRKELSVNHINGQKNDNRSENLEWVTPRENTHHAWRAGLIKTRGEKHPRSKLTDGQVVAIKEALRLGIPVKTLAAVANVRASTIYLIRAGRRQTSGEQSPTP